MAHCKAEVIESTCDLLKATDRQISLLKGVIAALENSRRATLMLTGAIPDENDDPLSPAGVTAAKGFIKNLSDKIVAAGGPVA